MRSIREAFWYALKFQLYWQESKEPFRTEFWTIMLTGMKIILIKQVIKVELITERDWHITNWNNRVSADCQSYPAVNNSSVVYLFYVMRLKVTDGCKQKFWFILFCKSSCLSGFRLNFIKILCNSLKLMITKMILYS